MNNSAEIKKIRTLIENWAKAVQDRNLEGAIAKHTDDIVMFDVPLPYQSKGIAEYQKTWELFFSSNQLGPESFKIDELEIIADDTVAFCFGILSIFKSNVRITIGLRRIEGEWFVAHEHHSYPINL